MSDDFTRFIEEVKERVSITDVVEKYVKLKKAGKSRFVGLCPFHQEKTPSFHVDAEKNLFHCFGCGKGGDAIKFLTEMERLSFMEALEELADKAGLEMPQRTREPALAGESNGGKDARARLLAANVEAARFFYSCLTEDPSCAHARAYLEKREIPENWSRKFGLGCAPDGYNALAQRLKAKGISEEDAEKAGLIVRSDMRYVDRFRNRLMFPVLMREKQPLGFSGRTLANEDAKYINTPETPLYQKSKILFGYHLAREAIRKSGEAILVEGNVDAMRMHMAGFGATVAPCGTALTEDQLRIIKRHQARLTIIFDGDDAGKKAAFRALPLVMAIGIDARVVFLPEKLDPDDFLRKYGADAMKKLIDAAEELFSAVISEKAKTAQSSQAKAELIRETAAIIAAAPDAAGREPFINRAAYLLSTREEAIRSAMQKAEGVKKYGEAKEAAKFEGEKFSRHEISLFACLLKNDSFFDDAQLMNRISKIALSQEARGLLQKAVENKVPLSKIAGEGDSPLRAKVREYLFSKKSCADEDDAARLEFALASLEREAVEEEINALAGSIKSAEAAGDNLRLRKLLEQRRGLLTRREEIKSTLQRSA